MERLAERVYMLRRKLGLTQSEVAERMGIDQSSYSRIERAQVKSIDRERLEDLAVALEVTVADLTNGGVQENSPDYKQRTYLFSGMVYSDRDGQEFVGAHELTGDVFQVVYIHPDPARSLQERISEFALLDSLRSTIDHLAEKNELIPPGESFPQIWEYLESPDMRDEVNAWLRRHFRFWVADRRVVRVEFL